MARGLLVAGVILVGATCRLDKLIVGPQGALLAVTPSMPDSLVDSAAFGSTAIKVDSAHITNDGGGELSWTATIKKASPWLSLDTASGVAPYYLKVLLNPTGLHSDTTYHDTVVVQSTGGQGALEVPIRFDIHSCRFQPIALDDSISSVLTTADCGAPHFPGRFAQLFSFPGTINDSVTIEVPAGFDAYVALDTALAPTALPFSEEDDCFGTPGNPCLYYQRLPRFATYYIEVTSADSGDTGSFNLRLLHPRRPNLPVSPEQLLSDSVTVIDIGDTITATSLLFRAVISDPDLGDVVHLEAEVRAVGTDFTGPNHPNGPAVANGQVAWITVSGLADNVSYHWRVRAGDNTGRQGEWVEFVGNPAFRIAVPHPPNPPTGLAQSKPDGTPLVVGAVADTDVVVFSGSVSDIDPGSQLRLQVEWKPIGTGFTNTASDSSLPVSGGVAQVKIGPFGNNQNYHWQARTVDETGRSSTPWTPFGNNPEGQTDFRIQLANVPEAPSSLAQYQSDGSTVITVGGDASQTNVVFKGIVTDPDVGQTVRLDVEYKPVLVSFTDTPTVSSTFVTNGSQATVGSLTLSPNTDYHWQARAVDNTGRQGGWVSFPTPAPNPETDPDFHVALPVSQLIFTAQPTDEVAGVAIAPPVRVTAADQFGAPVTSFTGNVTMTIDQGPVGGTLGGTTVVAAVAGVATFGNLILTKMGTYVLRATTSSPSLTITSGAFNITPAPTSQLVFTTNPPASVTAGAPMTVVVTAQDAFFNTTPSFVGSVTMAIAANPGNPLGTLSGTNPVTAANGVATFPNLSINKSGVGYTLRASSGALRPDTSTAITIIPGPATHLGFTAQPSDEGATVAISPPILVAGLDANDNVATSFTGAVTMAITPGTGTAGAALSGNNPVVAVNGTATFPNLSINLVGPGYTLTASAGGLTPDASVAFNITGVGNTRLVFTAQPTNTQAGATISSPGGVRVTAQDSFGTTITSFTGSVTLAITAGTGAPGAILRGTTTVAAVSGVATFTTLFINEAGTGYTLTATSPSAVTGSSATFNITPGPAVSLHYTGPPSTTAAGAQITPAVVVTARDALGNTATSFISLVSTTIASGPVGGAFTASATPNVNAVAGVATFSNLRLNRPGSYTLRAGSGALTPDISAAFTVTSTATQLTFTVQPVTTQAGIAFNPVVQVTAQDSLGNTATGFTGNVTVNIFDNPPPGGTLAGTKVVAAVSGVANFPTININRTGTGYTLIATATGLGFDVSNPFDIIPGAPSNLVFTVQPSNTPAGATISPAVRVTVQDNQGNTVTGFVGNVNMAIAPGTGTGGAFLSGTVSQPVGSGIATFPNLSIDLAGNLYQLQATSAGVVGAFNSNAFSITGGMATQLIFTIQPANSTAGIPINPAVQVTARDALGNTASFSGTVTISIASGPVGGGLTPSSTPAVAAVGGVANFTNLRLNKTGTPYTLQATSGALSTTSTGFSVAPGGVSSSLSTVSASPGSVTASNGASQSTITVTARDTLGNLIPSANVVFSATGTGNTITPSDITDGVGVATGTLSSTATGTKTVSVTIGGVAITQTAPVTVAPDVVSPTTSTMTRLPTTIGASTGSVTSTMTVTARDQFSNLIPNANVVFAATGTGNTLTPNPPAGVLTNASGVATGTLSSTVAELKVGSATINGTPITPTVNITVFAAAPKLLQFVVQPNATAAGAIIRAGTGVTVEVRDTFNNRVTTASNPVNIAILFNAGPGGILSGTTTATIPNGRLAGGVATFNDLSIDKTGTNYTLLTSSAGLTPDTSAQFPITAGGVSASQSTVSAAPTTIAASTGSSASTITVTVRDALGNPIQGATVVLSATPITGNTLTQPVGTTNASGVATGTLSSTESESKTVSATAQIGAGPVVSITQTAGVTVNAAGVSAAQSSVASAPGTIAACSASCTTGAGTASTITVTVRDAFGNPIQGAAVVLSSSGSNNSFVQPGSTNSAGVTSGTFSSSSAEAKTVSATAQVGAGPVVAITQTAAVTVTSAGPSASQSTVSAAPTTITASSGSSTSTITVTVRDALGNPIQGASVVLSASPITGNTLTQPSGTTNASGVATGTLSSTEAESKTVSATAQVGAGPIVSITQTAGVTVNPAGVSNSQSSVSAAPGTITASNGSSASTITVTVRDAFANPIPGATVVLSANPTTGNALTQPGGTTNGSGVATGTLSSTEAESKTVSATAQVGAGPVVAIIQTADVTVNPAGVSNSQSTVSAAPGTITASSGSSTSTITVTVRDAFANPIQGATVVLSASPITGNTLTQPVGTTNASGVATGTLSSTEAESKTVSATAQVGAGPVVGITQTAGVTVNPAAPSAAQSSVSAAPGTITASNGLSTSTITVTVRDAFDNLIQGAAVVLSSTGSNNVFVQPGNTNASGVTSGTFRSTTAEGKTISATAQVGAGPIVSITQTAAVTVDPAAADHLVFTTQPSDAQADPTTISPPVVLEIRDTFENLVTDATDQVTLAITNGTGTPTAQLLGTNPKAAVGGIVTFSNLSIDLIGIGYTLDATAAGMTGATSDPFDITL